MRSQSRLDLETLRFYRGVTLNMAVISQAARIADLSAQPPLGAYVCKRVTVQKRMDANRSSMLHQQDQETVLDESHTLPLVTVLSASTGNIIRVLPARVATRRAHQYGC